ncbi:F510_1955 family glycosylhydrolase [Arthrobacter sp. 35/47]|uniref:F510_1955 family glycosylhydrolase n=1 Tax=Arthrobacter sp. 35/47 TaxID=269454 RepID=UPI00047E56B9|nr:hypothetical protein [Arthrobacter sp. 35/47]
MKKKLAISWLAVVVLAVTACGQEAADETTGAGTSGDNPFGHVHGLSFEESSQRVLLASHEGLFDVTDEPIEKISPTLDLMGFAASSPDLYYASGHPGPGSDLPNPLGLVQSTDGGETWQELSRQGESDFHTMTVSSEGIIGFDGTLRFTRDGEEWTEVEAPFQPANLSAYAGSPTVLATTEEGVQRSTDGGLTWELPADSPVLLLTTFADEETVVGVSPDGVIYTSRDAGQTWEETGGTTAAPAAIAASKERETGLRIWVSTEQGIEYSGDSGASFTTTVRVDQ